VICLLDSLHSKERHWVQSSQFTQLRPYFMIVLVDGRKPSPRLIRSASLEELAVIANLLHKYPLDDGICCDRYTAYDHTIWRHTDVLLSAMRYCYGNESLCLPNVTAIIKTDLRHYCFYPIIKMIEHISVSPAQLTQLPTLRCFRYLAVSSFAILPKFQTFLSNVRS